jgi:hypothetical protein
MEVEQKLKSSIPAKRLSKAGKIVGISWRRIAGGVQL